MMDWLTNQHPFLVIYWGTLGFGVAIALFGGFMHLFGPCLMSWKARVDLDLAEAAVLAQQRREQEARGDEAMERIRVSAAVELAKYGGARTRYSQSHRRRHAT